MTSPNGWDAAEARRLRRILEADEKHRPDCACAACWLERIPEMCEGEVDAT